MKKQRRKKIEKEMEEEMEEEKFLFKPFDIVKFTDKNGTHYGMVISGGETASVDWFEKPCPYNAWWRKDDGLVVVNNAMKIIANEIESAATIGYSDYTPQGDRCGWIDDVEKGQLDFNCPDIPKPWDEINANNIHDRMVEKWKEQIKTLKP